MEKITYKPLIDHLQEQYDSYNQLYRNYQMKYGELDHQLLSVWMVEVIEPVIKEVTGKFPEKIGSVFKAIYSELLQLLGSKIGITYENEYVGAWYLCTRIPDLFATTPTRIIKAINSAIESIRSHQPEKVMDWIDLMKSSAPNCKTIEDFLAIGRVNAWRCGMAHLRERAFREYAKLDSAIKADLNANTAIKLEKAFEREWAADLKTAEFIGEAGGFAGYGGPFNARPYIAEVEGQLLVTDGFESYAFFGDQFGKVILRDIPVSPNKVFEKLSREDVAAFKQLAGEYVIAHNDVSSCVLKNSTFVFTRLSSHYLFIYALPV